MDGWGEAATLDLEDFDPTIAVQEREDYLRMRALGDANQYAMHREGGESPEDVGYRAQVYANFLLGLAYGRAQ